MEIWLIVFFILMLIEFVTAGLVCIWFALGAMVTAICANFVSDATMQITIFTFVSVISLLCTRPFINKFLKKKDINTNLDMVIGKIGLVTEDIKELSVGEVKVDGKRWSALAVSSKEIKKGSKVEILSIDGVKLVVKERKEN